MKYKCLSIAGFDGSGGAGIQADLKTFSATGSYGMTVLTSLPVQNTSGVRNIYDIPLQCIEEQLHAIFDDIIPDAIKIGMVYSIAIIEFLSNFLEQYGKNIPIVLDPVMVSKNGNFLLKEEAIESFKKKLIPLSSIITPNLEEAQKLVPYEHKKEILVKKILDFGCQAVLLKGGHDHNQYRCDDLFLSHKKKSLLSGKRITSKNTHGTGCTLSAAIASYIAQGCAYLEACQKAKDYLSECLLAGANENIGKGFGPLHHFYHLWKFL